MKPICLFCHHKSGTVLLKSVFEELCNKNKWIFKILLGKQNSIPKGIDITLYAHSLLDVKSQKTPFVGVHIIRDPRDVIVSGYLYHLRTTEAWCIQKKFDLSSPIDYPNVPFSQQHRSESWKKEYIRSLNGCSYQETLRALPQEDGIMFEMKHYGSWTIESMLDWRYGESNVLEMHFEEIMADYEHSFRLIFTHIGLRDIELQQALEVANRHNINNKTKKEIEAMNHVHSKQTTRWQNYLTPKHMQLFDELFGGCLVKLGYQD